MAEAAFPHGARPCPGKQKPADLNEQRLHEIGSFQSAKEDRNRTEELVVEGQPFHHRLNRVRHDVDGKHLAAQEIFERINDENDGGNFQNPKRHHRQAVSDKELNECCHQDRHGRKHIDHRIGGQHDVVSEINKDQRDRRQGDEAVNESATQKDAEPVRKITHRLREKRIDLAFANVSGNLPFVLCWYDQVADQEGEQII